MRLATSWRRPIAEATSSRSAAASWANGRATALRKALLLRSFLLVADALNHSGEVMVRDLTEAGVDRILAAVGEKFVSSQVNKTALLRALALYDRRM